MIRSVFEVYWKDKEPSKSLGQGASAFRFTFTELHLPNTIFNLYIPIRPFKKYVDGCKLFLLHSVTKKEGYGWD